MCRADGTRASAALPGTGGRGGALARPARCAAALLVTLAALLALPLQAQAQSVGDLVSNLNVSTSANDFKGPVGDDGKAVAQKFSVPEGSDYFLSDVTINVDTKGDQTMVLTIRRGGGSTPGSTVHTLNPPASPGTGWETYTAPSGAVLEGGRSYYVMLTAPSGGDQSKVKAVFKDDDTGLEGWSIGNAMLQRRSNGSWANAARYIAQDAAPRP